MLKFRIEGQKLTWENPDEVVVAGTKKYLECYFEFDVERWPTQALNSNHSPLN